MAKESAQKGHFYILQLNSHRITLTENQLEIKILLYIIFAFNLWENVKSPKKGSKGTRSNS